MPVLTRDLVTATVTFAATNIDDIFLLTLFFAQTNTSIQRWRIVAGQYFGFTGLILISLLGFVVGLVVSRVLIGLLGVVPILLGLRHWFRRGEADQKEANEEEQVRAAMQARSVVTITSVAAVTFANGGDNIGVYTPLFASSDLTRVFIFLCVFYILVGVWCFVGYVVGRNSMIATLITRYGHLIVPFVLIEAMVVPGATLVPETG